VRGTLTEPLTITTTERADHQLDMTIVLGPERTDEALHRAAKQVSKRRTIPGFRPGKAPYGTVLRLFGRDALLGEVLEDLTSEVIEEALKEQQLDPPVTPSLENVDLNPVTMKLVIPLPPKVELGDYQSIRVDAPDTEVTDAEVEAEILKLREQKQTRQDVDRPAAMGDVVVTDITGHVGEDQIMDNQDWELPLKEDSGWLPGFTEAFVGLSAGDEKDFSLAYPEDSTSRYKGQTANFSAKVKSVKGNLLPVADDEFAKAQGKYADLADMTSQIRERLMAQREHEAEHKVQDDAIDALLAMSTVLVPPPLVESEVDRLVDSLRSRLAQVGYKLEDYFTLQHSSEAAYRKSLEEGAERNVKAKLALAQVAELEGKAVTSDDLDTQIEQLAKASGEEYESWKLQFSTPRARKLLAAEFDQERGLARLVGIATGKPASDEAEIPADSTEPPVIDTPAAEADTEPAA
jgi:trigger factor